MYTSGTPTLRILLGAGHYHGPWRPISVSGVKCILKSKAHLFTRLEVISNKMTSKQYVLRTMRLIDNAKENKNL